MAGQWFYASGGGQTGPVETADLRRLADEGTLRPTDLVWREGQPEWVPASKVPELSGTAAGDATPAVVEAPPAGAPAPGAAPYYAEPAAVLPYQGGGVPVGISARTMELLRQTRPWVLFISILGFILAGLMVIGGLGVFAMEMMSGGTGVPAWLGMAYIAFAAVYLFPSLYLCRYGMRIGSLLARGQVEDLERALESQKSFWRLSGIIVIAVIVVYIAVVAIAVGVGFN
jgi:hypothetical protein